MSQNHTSTIAKGHIHILDKIMIFHLSRKALKHLLIHPHVGNSRKN